MVAKLCAASTGTEIEVWYADHRRVLERCHITVWQETMISFVRCCYVGLLWCINNASGVI